MEKRELITKEEAKMALTGIFDEGFTVDEYIASSLQHMKAIKPISKLEIVKPYINELKAELIKATMDSYNMPVKRLSADEITETIDILLERIGE